MFKFSKVRRFIFAAFQINGKRHTLANDKTHTRANDKDHRHVAGHRNGVEKSKPGLPLEQIEPKKIKKIVSF